MILYKNVDICDLKSIITKGILSMNECQNNNWDENKRATNDTSIVYLFSPTGEQNSFPEYGAALIEVNCEAKKRTILEQDAHLGKYNEYTTNKVDVNQICRIIIPEIFKPYIKVPKNAIIIWCGMKAQVYNEYTNGCKKEAATEEELALFAKTAELEHSNYFNYFRGHQEDGTVMDLYDIKYIF